MAGRAGSQRHHVRARDGAGAPCGRRNRLGYRTSSFAPHDVLVECELAVEPPTRSSSAGRWRRRSRGARRPSRSPSPPAAACSRTPKAPRPGRSSNRQPQGRAPWRRPGVGGACELHREHGRCHGGRRLRAHRTHTDEGARGPWRRTLARSTVPRVRVGRRPPVAALRPRAPLAAPPRLPAAHLPPAVPARRVGARGKCTHAQPFGLPGHSGGRAASSAGRSARASQGRSPQAYAAPRMSSVRVGDLDRAARNDRARKTYRRHVVRLAILAAVVLTLAVGAPSCTSPTRFPSRK